mgnify:FL=1
MKVKTIRIGIVDTFSASHLIPDHPKCSSLHGHNYRVEVVLEGNLQNNGMVLDFSVARNKIREVLSLLDHAHLNDILPEIPTAENIAIFIAKRLSKIFSSYGLKVCLIRVWETDKYWAEVVLA